LKRKMVSKALSILMCLAVLLSCMPLSVLAAETEVTIQQGVDFADGGEDKSGTGWSYSNRVLTLEEGYRFHIKDNVTCSVENNGTIGSGSFVGIVDNKGTISGGTFSGVVKNKGIIDGGTFTGSVSNSGTIKSGAFSGQVNNVSGGVIVGGNFDEEKMNNSGHRCYDTSDVSYELGTNGHIRVETCKNCPVNSVRKAAEAAHSVGAEGDKAATCTAQAYCSVCELSYGEKAAHDWKDGVCKICTTACAHKWDNGVCKICTFVCAHGEKRYVCLDEENHQQVCAVCSVTIGDPAGHTGGTANCVEPKTCDDCKTAYGEKNPANHASAETRFRTINENGHAQHAKVYSCCGQVIETFPHKFGDDNICDDCNMKPNVLLTHGETEYGYNSFQAALAAAQELDGSVMKLCSYSEGSDTSYEIKKGTFTIDLNGCSISSNKYYVNTFEIDGGDVTITDTSASKSGTIRPGNHTINLNGGTLRLHGGTIEAGSSGTYGVDMWRASLYIDGGSVKNVRAEGMNSKIWIGGDDTAGVTETTINLLYHPTDEGYPVIRIAEKLSGDDIYIVYKQQGTNIFNLGVIAQGDNYTLTAKDAARFKAYQSEYVVELNSEDNTLELKKQLTAQLSVTEVTYNSSEQKPVLTVNAQNENTDYTVTYLRDGKATEDFINAGVITVEVNGMGDYAGKHTFTYTIKPVEVKIVGAEFEDKVYDGTKTLTLKSVTSSGYQSSDDISVDFSEATAVVSDAKAGTYDSVTLSGLTLAGTDAKNYELSQPVELDMDVTIAKADARELAASLKIRNDMARTYKVDMSKFAPKEPMVWGNEQFVAELEFNEEDYDKITAKITNGQLVITVPKVTSDLEETVGEVKIAVTSDNFEDSVITVRLLSQEPVEYKITKGDGGKWYKNSKKDLSFTVNGDYKKFTSVEVDGKALDKSNYDTKSGSTILTLENAYLKKLTTGKHTIKVWYTDGVASGTFNVRPASEIPETGDSNAVFLWGGALALSCVGLLAVVTVIRRKNKS